MPARFETVIGLEVHAHLLTRSKMFCGCATAFGAPPNSQTCPVCQGMPGSLPLINGRAIEFGIKTALALGCTVVGAHVHVRHRANPNGALAKSRHWKAGTAAHIERVRRRSRARADRGERLGLRKSSQKSRSPSADSD